MLFFPISVMARNNRTAVASCEVDALGKTICRSFAPFGNAAAEWGAAYPVCGTYDTQGRRTPRATTCDGAAWDGTI